MLLSQAGPLLLWSRALRTVEGNLARSSTKEGPEVLEGLGLRPRAVLRGWCNVLMVSGPGKARWGVVRNPLRLHISVSRASPSGWPRPLSLHAVTVRRSTASAASSDGVQNNVARFRYYPFSKAQEEAAKARREVGSTTSTIMSAETMTVTAAAT